jgi:hypothetical protein
MRKLLIPILISLSLGLILHVVYVHFKSLPEPCPSSSVSDKLNCYRLYYHNLALNKGIDVAFNDLKSRYKTNDFVARACHHMSHMIGHAGALLYPDISTAFSHGDDFCGSGYYHGVVEGAAILAGKSKFLNNINSICAKMPGKSDKTIEYYNCIHGLGHGLMYVLKNDLFASLKACDSLTDPWEQESCSGGVFMQNLMFNGTVQNFTFDDPLYPCDTVDDKYKYGCLTNQISYALAMLNGNFPRVFNECTKFVYPYNKYCYDSIGSAAVAISKEDLNSTLRICTLGGTTDQIKYCVGGAAKDLIIFYHSREQADELCLTAPPEFRDYCRAVTDRYAKEL